MACEPSAETLPAMPEEEVGKAGAKGTSTSIPMLVREAALPAKATKNATWSFWGCVGRVIDLRTRMYLEAIEEVRTYDLLMFFEVLVAFAVSEFWLRVAIPGLGLVNGEACPWAEHVGRAEMFVYGPIGYIAMYIGVCGSIHVYYTKLRPDVGKQLSLQNKPMSDAEFQKAIGFSMKSILSTTALSGFFYHAMRGETNLRCGRPEVRELPWLMLGYLMVDIMSYLCHRCMHRPWWYARVHKVHHLWKSPNVWVVSALHPTELLMLAVPPMVIMASLPLSFFTMCTFFVLYFACNAIDHSGMDLHHLPLCRCLFWQAPPEFHDNHHAHFHANYGAMVDWWDRLGGTYYHPSISNIKLSEDQFVSVRELKQQAGGG